MPITLIPNRTQYTSLSQQINVKMDEYWRGDIYKAKNTDRNLKCTIKHDVEVKDNQANTLFAKNASTEWTWTGQIQAVSEPWVGANIYKFVVPTTNPLPTISQQFNPDAPQYSNLKKLSITLMFDSSPNAPTNLELILPVSHDWAGTLTVSFPGSGILDASLRLVNQPWGLPSVRSQQQKIHPRATYLAQTNNLLVKLYNDASEDAAGYTGAFADICDAIAQAQHFIFIADWSFHPDTYMQRPAQGAPNDNDKIGMMLINKARGKRFDGTLDPQANPQNMVIAIHTWYHLGQFMPDDPTNNIGGPGLDALSGGANGRPQNLLWRMTERSGILLSHHQKFVVLDAPVAPNNQDREIKVFFGGLDLTTGRFDWPGHFIHYDASNDSFYRFRDWYNPEFAATVEADTRNVSTPGSTPSVPRQPWHDIHAQLLGPAAWDFLDEFVGRWQATGTLFASQGQGFRGPETEADTAGRVWKKYVDICHMAHSGGGIILPSFHPNYQYPQARPWTAQVCRSMGDKFWSPPAIPQIGESVRDKVPPTQKVLSHNLCRQLTWNIKHKKPRTIADEFEKSIHKAYLQAIARAEDFIYIETQYLIGESQLKTNSTNRIPKAIIDRIKAINALPQQPDFHVYIVTPLYPEGDPLKTPVQPVRYNQWETMKWMKNQLVNLQGGKQWTNYLSFYFLGQRHGAVGANHPNSTTRQTLVQHSNRYMIYVHSKLMIVDDRWIILGSANLNERSMAGNRDSEICVAMWPTPGHQDAQTAVNKIKDFRQELWREHLAGSAGYALLRNTNGVDAFDQPKAAATVTAIRTAAQHNFHEFCRNDAAPNQMGHLMYWDWTSIDTNTGYLPDSPAGETKLLWAPTELGLPPGLGNLASLAEWSPDGFR